MKAKNIAMIGVLIALISVSAFIRVPMPMIPFTLQVLVVLLAPMLVGPKISFAAVTLYIILGLAGIPIFASGGGPAYVFMPSFGFLLGYIASTIPNGLISGQSSKFLRNFAAGAVGLAFIYLFGVVGFWLNMNYIQGKEISFWVAMTIAVIPFIIPDLIKLTVAVLIAKAVKRVLT